MLTENQLCEQSVVRIFVDTDASDRGPKEIALVAIQLFALKKLYASPQLLLLIPSRTLPLQNLSLGNTPVIFHSFH